MKHVINLVVGSALSFVIGAFVMYIGIVKYLYYCGVDMKMEIKEKRD